MLGELSNYNIQPRLFSYLISDGSECELVRKNWVVFSQSRSSSNLLLIIQIFPQSINQGVLVEIIVRSEIDFCLVKIVLNSC